MRKVKRYPSYKSFGGKVYGRNISYGTKQEAVAHANRLRQSGDRVRITTFKLLTGETRYVTWLRKARGR